MSLGDTRTRVCAVAIHKRGCNHDLVTCGRDGMFRRFSLDIHSVFQLEAIDLRF